MMSGSDGPGFTTAAAVTINTTTTTTTTTDDATADNADGSEMKQIWKFIYVDMTFVKSIYGIILAAEIILSLIGLICVSIPSAEHCAFLYSSTYSYYEFSTSSLFITALIWYFLYALAITKKLGFIRWDIAEVIYCLFYAFHFLISSSVIAANACSQGGYKAAAVFGFFLLIVIVGHGVYRAKSVWERRTQARSEQSEEATAEEASKY